MAEKKSIWDVFDKLTEKVSRKAVTVVIAMFLVYLIIVTPTAAHALVGIGVISSLSLVVVFMQWLLDRKK